MSSHSPEDWIIQDQLKDLAIRDRDKIWPGAGRSEIAVSKAVTSAMTRLINLRIRSSGDSDLSRIPQAAAQQKATEAAIATFRDFNLKVEGTPPTTSKDLTDRHLEVVSFAELVQTTPESLDDPRPFDLLGLPLIGGLALSYCAVELAAEDLVTSDN